jgi:hypothetical protein
MTETQADAKLPYAERIAKLLKKAENTDSQPEADALFGKAQQLMVKYAISEELLAQVDGRDIVQDHVVQDYIRYTGIFHMFQWDIGNVIAQVNDCKTLISKAGKSSGLTIIGMSKDVERVKLLNASIQLQAAVAERNWWRVNRDRFAYGTAFDKVKERRSFLSGYASGLRVKLMDAKRAGTNDAVTDVADATKTAAADVRKSTELVLVSKKRKIDDWVDSEYGRTLRKVSRNYAAGGMSSRQAGTDAGRRANVNTSSGSVGRTTRGSIGS